MVNDISFLEEPDGIERLRLWLADRPFDWGIWLSTRAIWKVFPSIVEASSSEWLARNSLYVCHALFSATASYARPIKGHKKAAVVSLMLLAEPAQYKTAEGYFAASVRNLSAAVCAKAKIDKIDSSVRALSLLQTSLLFGVTRVENEDMVPSSLKSDIGFLMSQRNERRTYLLAARGPSIRGQMGEGWFHAFLRAWDRILSIDESFLVWRDWAIGAVAGRRLNFFEDDFATDAQLRDRQASLNIIQQVNREFWERQPNSVNRDVEGWVGMAAAGVMGDPTNQPSIPPQNENAISFSSDAEGRITINSITHYNEVRVDEDTLDRYNETIKLAADIRQRCEGSNAGARLVKLFDNYIEAAADKLDKLRPSLFVQRGDRLRKEVAAYADPQTMLSPLADDILLDLRSWQSAHNLFVGLDPGLMARDTAMHGPDERIASVSPTEIRDIVADADEAGLLSDEVVDVVNEAANLAPLIPDPLNRRTVWSFETGRNLIIETFNIAMKYPSRVLVGSIVAGSVLPGLGFAGAIGGAAVGAIPAAKFLLRHRSWIENRMGDSPTWQSLFISLIGWIEGNTPLKAEMD